MKKNTFCGHESTSFTFKNLVMLENAEGSFFLSPCLKATVFICDTYICSHEFTNDFIREFVAL